MHTILGSAAPPFLTEVVALIVAGAVIAYISFRIRLVPIVGFILAGVIIGPHALGLVKDQALVDSAAEIGVILLLFTIGIEFSLEKLARIKRLIFGGGLLQVGLASLATVAVLAAFGIGWRVGLFTGFLVALSSTAIVLKLLAEKGATNQPFGQVGLGLLIFQDLAIIVMVMVVPILGGTGGSSASIALALGKAVAIIVVVLVFARKLMPRVLEKVALTCSPELFLLAVIAICFGTAYLTNLAGVSLSLGAFLAGLLVSESRFSEHALGETMPLQILFSATFFVSVGMLLDLRFLVANIPLVLASIGIVLAIKIVTTGFSVLALGYKLPVAVASGLMLAQVGEFSFVLERTGRDAGLFPAGLAGAGSQAFIATTVVLMIATPFLTELGTRLAARLTARAAATSAARIDAEDQLADLPELSDHVIVAGYGQAARRLVRVLGGSSIPYVITTLSPTGANEAEAESRPVLRGDASRPRILLHVGVERAKMMVIADDDPATAQRIAAVARGLNPTMRIVVRTRYIAEVEALRGVGADLVIAEELESIVQLFSEVMRDYRIDPAEIELHEEAIRRGGYAALRDEPAPGGEPVVRCELGDDCLDTRTVLVREGSPLAGRSKDDAELAGFGIAVDAIRRGPSATKAAGDGVIAVGDEVVLAGTTASFARAASAFRPAGTKIAGDVIEALESPSLPAIDTERAVRVTLGPTSRRCGHVVQIREVHPSARGCEDCLRIGDTWVHLRLCMTCGHVGCCDTSKNRHASVHHAATRHPIILSLERGEDWMWCYVDERYIAEKGDFTRG